jgi:hypothetical protein
MRRCSRTATTVVPVGTGTKSRGPGTPSRRSILGSGLTPERLYRVSKAHSAPLLVRLACLGPASGAVALSTVYLRKTRGRGLAGSSQAGGGTAHQGGTRCRGCQSGVHRAVRRLHLSGASLRELGAALHLSHQRVHQIVESARGAPMGKAGPDPAASGQWALPEPCYSGGSTNGRKLTPMPCAA